MNPNTNITTADLAFGLKLLGRASVGGRIWVAFDDGAYRHVVERCHWNNATAMLPGQDTADAYTDWCDSGRECWADDATAEIVARQCSLTYVNSATDGACGRIDIDLDGDA
jgi:hypothetical protein